MSRQASGMRAWFFQRLTAVYMLFYFPYLILKFATSPPADAAEWMAWVGHPGVGVGILLFVATLLLHAWVGVRDTAIDYVPPIGLRVAVLSLFGFAFVGCGFWALKVVVLAQTLA